MLGRAIPSIALALLAVFGVTRFDASLSAQAASSAGPDIVGFRLGTPLAEAYKLLKSYKPVGHLAVGEVSVPELGANKLPHRLVWTDGTTEWIQLNITLPPNPQVVWSVHRTMYFPEGLLQNELVAGLTQKYGKSTGLGLSWNFDDRGQLVTDAGHCTSRFIRPASISDAELSFPDPLPDQPLRQVQETPGRRPCAPLTHLVVGIGGDQGSGLARSMDASLVDNGLIARAHRATYEQIMRVRSGEGAKELEKLKQRPIPNL